MLKNLIQHYTKRLEKVKAHWLTGTKEGSLVWDRGMEYVTAAESDLEAVKNGREW